MQTSKQITRSSLKRRRRGVLSMELVLTLPILGLLLMGMFEFAMLFFAQGTVAEASRLGARRATMQGVTEEDIDQQVRYALGRRFAAVADIRVTGGNDSGEPVAVAVAVPMSAASPDLLWPTGFSLQGRNLVSQTRMIKE